MVEQNLNSLDNPSNLPSKLKGVMSRNFSLLSEVGDIDSMLLSLEDELLVRRTIDISHLSAEEQFAVIKFKSLQILPENDLLQKLKESKENGSPLKVKFGIDPTGSDVHLGHSIPMVVLNRLQRMGHDITFIIGDFTAKIGDPSGRVSARPPLSDEQIQKNLATYKDQVKPFFDLDKVRIVYNSQWLSKTPASEILANLAKVPVSTILQREDFRDRLKEGSGLTMAEIVYPIFMGLDSVHLGCDIEVGGVDQLLNMQVCRQLMENNGQRTECIVSTILIEGINGDGKKMSKSLGNYIALNDTSEDVYGKLMSIPDSLLEQYFHTLTEITHEEWTTLNDLMKAGKLNPLKVKKLFARIMVSILYDKETAKQEQDKFEKKFAKKDYSSLEDIPTFSVQVGLSVVDFLVDNALISSKGEARRLIHGGGLKLIDPVTKGESKVSDPKSSFELENNGFFMKIGKTNIIRLQFN